MFYKKRYFRFLLQRLNSVCYWPFLWDYIDQRFLNKHVTKLFFSRNNFLHVLPMYFFITLYRNMFYISVYIVWFLYILKMLFFIYSVLIFLLYILLVTVFSTIFYFLSIFPFLHSSFIFISYTLESIIIAI